MDDNIVQVGNMLVRVNEDPTSEPEQEQKPELPPIPYKWIHFNIALVGAIVLLTLTGVAAGVIAVAADNLVYHCKDLPKSSVEEVGPQTTAYITGTKVVVLDTPNTKATTPREDCYQQNLAGISAGDGLIGGFSIMSMVFGGLLWMILERKKEIEAEYYAQYGNPA